MSRTGIGATPESALSLGENAPQTVAASLCEPNVRLALSLDA